jgi:hypothetical protein
LEQKQEKEMERGQIRLTRDEMRALRELAKREHTDIADLLRRLALAEAMRQGLYPSRSAGAEEVCDAQRQ